MQKVVLVAVVQALHQLAHEAAHVLVGELHQAGLQQAHQVVVHVLEDQVERTWRGRPRRGYPVCEEEEVTKRVLRFLKEIILKLFKVEVLRKTSFFKDKNVLFSYNITLSKHFFLQKQKNKEVQAKFRFRFEPKMCFSDKLSIKLTQKRKILVNTKKKTSLVIK